MLVGWYATGLLQPLWDGYGDPDDTAKRDRLARAVGTSPSVLSQINTGSRRLGLSLAQRLADELGVSVYDLGAPTDTEVEQGQARVVDRLQELVETVDELLESRETMSLELERLHARVRALETVSGGGGASSKGPRTAAR